MKTTFHPAAVLIYLGAVFSVVMCCNRPLVIFPLLLIILTTLFLLTGKNKLKKTLTLAALISLPFVLVNALLSQRGAHILWQGPALPLIGPLSVSAEAILFAATMAAKLVLAVILCMLAEVMIAPDAVFDLTAGHAPKSALLFILAALSVPRFRRDVRDIRELMKTRGVPLDDAPLIPRTRYAMLLLHALLISALEGAWDTAIALDGRAFASGKRTKLRRKPWCGRDYFAAVPAAGVFLLLIINVFSWRYAYGFFPTPGPLVTGAGYIHYCAALLVLITFPLFIGRSRIQ
jgi:energy-coupling factor transport system permease protein